MVHSRQIFNRREVNRRRSAALADDGYPDFLDKLICTELISRLEMIDRRFEKCLVLGQPALRFLKEIKQSPKLQTVYAQSFFESKARDVVYDSEWLPFKDNSLDCIIAPPGLELVNDLPGVLIQINRALKPDGLFLAAMYGGHTLAELRHAWLLADEEITGGASPRVAPFIDVRQAGNLLQRAGLALPVADMEVLTVRYDSALALMCEVKKMGLANALSERRKSFTSKRMIALVDEHYTKLFADDDGRVRASVEINYLTAWSPHESQQKPLKPGSALKSLADVLTKKD